VGVISLPAGVFQPYSGVKTSILIMDKALNQKSDSIFFAKVENDGFSLGSQRKPISQNDLPNILDSFRENQTTDLTWKIPRAEVLADKNISLSGKQMHEAATMSSFDMVTLGEMARLQNGFSFKSSNYVGEGNRIIRITNVQKGLIIDDDPKFHPNLEPKDHQKFSLFDRDILVSLTGNVGRVGRLTKNLEPAYLNQRVSKIEVTNPNHLNSDYLYWILNSNIFERDCIENSTGVAQKNLSTKWIEEFSIPLPPLEVQQEIVDELEGYQKIIDGCKQVIENHKPIIDIDPSWEMVELGEITNISTGKLNANAASENGAYPFFTCSKEISKINEYTYDQECILLSGNNAAGNYDVKYYKGKFDAYQRVYIISLNEESKAKVDYQILYYSINQQLNILKNLSVGSLTRYLTLPIVQSIKIPIPQISIQKEIIQKIEEEKKVIEGNKKLIEIYTQKIQDRINKVWGE